MYMHKQHCAEPRSKIHTQFMHQGPHRDHAGLHRHCTPKGRCGAVEPRMCPGLVQDRTQGQSLEDANSQLEDTKPQQLNPGAATCIHSALSASTLRQPSSLERSDSTNINQSKTQTKPQPTTPNPHPKDSWPGLLWPCRRADTSAAGARGSSPPRTFASVRRSRKHFASHALQVERPCLLSACDPAIYI